MSKEIEAACKLLADLQERLYKAAETGDTSENVDWALIAAHELMHLSYIIGRHNDDLKGARNVAKLQETADKVDFNSSNKNINACSSNNDIAMIFYDKEDGYDYSYDEDDFDIEEDTCADNNQIPLSEVSSEDMLGFPRVHAHIKSVCKECSGTGVLDFGFYTRKCMKCSQG